MLRVPKLRQSDETSCLPTCVEAVLRYLGYMCSPEDIREWCYATNTGCDADLAVQGLRDAGYDAVLDQLMMSELAEMVESGYPPILFLSEAEDWYHAAVVCEITDEGIVLMDPRIGDYQFLTYGSLSDKWVSGHSEVMQVGKSSS